MLARALPLDSHRSNAADKLIDRDSLVAVTVHTVADTKSGVVSYVVPSQIGNAPAQRLENAAWGKITQQHKSDGMIRIVHLRHQVILPGQQIIVQMIKIKSGRFSFWRVYEDSLLTFVA